MSRFEDRQSPMNADLTDVRERVAGPDFHAYILDGLTDPTVTEEHRSWCVAAAERHGIEVPA